MLYIDENIDKSTVIQILQYFIQKESEDWFITDFKIRAPGATTEALVDLFTSELMFDQDRDRKSVV